MKNWQKWIVIVLVMALPVTGFAGLSFEPHCDSHTEEINSSSDQNAADHCVEGSELSQTINQNLQSDDDCQCECNNHIACVGAGTVAITALSKTSIANSGDPLIYYTSRQIVSLNLSTIFRPPIVS